MGSKPGVLSNRWKGGEFITKEGYKVVYRPEHPDSWKLGYIYAHRLVAEEKIGRRIKSFPKEVINHIDGDKLNNDPDNIEVMSNGDHTRLTHKKYDDKPKECLICGDKFYKKYGSLKQWNKRKYCSLKCYGKATHYKYKLRKV